MFPDGVPRAGGPHCVSPRLVPATGLRCGVMTSTREQSNHRTPSAAWTTRDLIGALARSGWGILAGADRRGQRVVLEALANVLPYGSGQGSTTAGQLAATSGYSERWVRRSLGALEDLGIITWTRGRVIAGRPTPSTIRVVKLALVAIIKAARLLDRTGQAVRDGAVQLGRRLARLGRDHVRPRRRAHAELASDLPAIGRNAGPVDGPASPSTTTTPGPSGPCDICGLPRAACEARARTNGHPYTPPRKA